MLGFFVLVLVIAGAVVPPAMVTEYSANATIWVNGTEAAYPIVGSIGARAARLTVAAHGVYALMDFSLGAQFVFPMTPREPPVCYVSQNPPLLLLTQFSLVEAPGTVYNGTDRSHGVPCDIWFNPVGNSDDGQRLCTAADGTPVWYSFTLPGVPVAQLEEEYADFVVGNVDPSLFELPPACAAAYTGVPSPPIGIRDGFERGLSSVWLPGGPGSLTYAIGAIVTQASVVRSGLGAANITVHPGDVSEGGGYGKTTERAELVLPDFLWKGRRRGGGGVSICLLTFRTFPTAL